MKLKKTSSSALALVTVITLQQSHAGTTWDGGGGANSNIDFADNWDGTSPGVVNALNGTTAATFGTGGSVATMNVDGYFTTLTFNRDNASGFTVNGPSTLSVLASTGGATANFSVSDTASNGVTTINAPFKVNTDAGGTRLLTIDNREAGTTGASLVFTGAIGATATANAYGMRFGSSGITLISGAISNVSSIQQASIGSQNMSGSVTISGAQSLGTATVNIAGTGSGTVASTAKFVMGSSTSDVQSWASTTINQAGMIEVKSTATLSGGVGLSSATTGGASGGTLDVSGNLNATTLAIGSIAYTGILRVSGNATFSGKVESGTTAGSKIVGGGVSAGTLTLASGIVGSGVVLGGAGTNENNFNIVKTDSSGTLTLSGANTFSGTTTATLGILLLSHQQAIQNSTLVMNAGTVQFASTVSPKSFTIGGLSGTTALALQDNAASPAVIALTVGGNNADTSYSGVLSGSGSLIKNGSGTLTFNGASPNTFSGGLTINSGKLVAGTGQLGALAACRT